MSSTDAGLVFGPIPSRRLGRSLGVNNVPMKTCSYSCVYCQLGPTPQTTIERRTFHAPEVVADAVRRRLEALRRRGEDVDHVTFVPDGEPTLDVALGSAIDRLRPLGPPVAVMTNASLLQLPDVRRDLAKADWVSLKIDAVHEDIWRRQNRPHPALAFAHVLGGMRRFADGFRGTLVTETMLVKGINDDEVSVAATAAFVARLQPAVAYLAVPTRPPAESWVEVPDARSTRHAFDTFRRRVPRVELLGGYPAPRLASSGDVVAELLAITAVHPLRDVEVDALLAKAGASRSIVEDLVQRGDLRVVLYNDQRFFVRAGTSR